MVVGKWLTACMAHPLEVIIRNANRSLIKPVGEGDMLTKKGQTRRPHTWVNTETRTAKEPLCTYQVFEGNYGIKIPTALN